MKNGLHIDEYGNQEWYLNDQIHRDDAPAVIDKDGTQKWYQWGKLHRTDGPAIVQTKTHKHWFKNGLRHRENGPALIIYGRKFWYINGIELSKQEFEKYTIQEKIKKNLESIL